MIPKIIIYFHEKGTDWIRLPLTTFPENNRDGRKEITTVYCKWPKKDMPTFSIL